MRALVVLAVLAVSFVPVASASGPEMQSRYLPASQTIAADVDCVDDNDYEEIRVESDGSLFLPSAGCEVAYDSHGIGAVTAVQFKMTGHEGQMCGSLVFSGALVGESSLSCTDSAGSGVVYAQVRTVAGDPGQPLIMTWHPTVSAIDNAYVCWLHVAGNDVGNETAPDCFGQGADLADVCLGLWAQDNGDGSVTVTWPPFQNATGYFVQQREVAPESTGFSPVATVDANITSYTATGLSAGASYGFAVTPTPVDAEGAWSCAVFAQSGGESAKVPFFPTPMSWAVAGLCVLVAGLRLRRGRAA